MQFNLAMRLTAQQIIDFLFLLLCQPNSTMTTLLSHSLPTCVFLRCPALQGDAALVGSVWCGWMEDKTRQWGDSAPGPPSLQTVTGYTPGPTTLKVQAREVLEHYLDGMKPVIDGWFGHRPIDTQQRWLAARLYSPQKCVNCVIYWPHTSDRVGWREQISIRSSILK